jgi:GTP-binding protein HflX
VEDRLFATLDPLTRGDSAKTRKFRSPTPSDSFASAAQFSRSFRATLEEVNEADLLMHVIDASHPMWEEQRDMVEEVLPEPRAEEKPVPYVFSKIDALPGPHLVCAREWTSNWRRIPRSGARVAYPR